MKYVDLYYYTVEQNFGDLLNESIFEKLFGYKVRFAPPERCRMTALGSNLETLLDFRPWRQRWFGSKKKDISREPVIVWGGGFIKEKNPAFAANSKEHFIRGLILRLVRGETTRRRLVQSKVKAAGEVPLADPGLLASHLIGPTPKIHSLGIVPHYVDQNLPFFSDLAKTVKGSILINVMEPAEKVLKEIASCEAVIASAMHGLIAADSLGIPNKWAIASDKLVGGKYKFFDYYSVYGLRPEPIELGNFPITRAIVDKIRAEYAVPHKSVESLQQTLYQSFPGDMI